MTVPRVALTIVIVRDETGAKGRIQSSGLEFPNTVNVGFEPSFVTRTVSLGSGIL